MPQVPQPVYVLRGHSCPIHAVRFSDNSRLLTGDADGWVVLWDTTTWRPTAVWRPHTTTILGLDFWGADRIITHGRDNKLLAWHLTPDHPLSTALPVEDAESHRPAPWLLHSLAVNALNFCSFASHATDDALLLAVPGASDGAIAIYTLPSETMHSHIAAGTHAKVGMLMALSMSRESAGLVLVAGYEGGQTVAWRYVAKSWTEFHRSAARTQPVLSLALNPDATAFYSSGADAGLVRHALDGEVQTVNTKHAGQQGLAVRSDGRIIATAGWDGRGRVYSARTLEEVAVLAWHKEGCYAAAFAPVREEVADASATTTVAQRRANKARNTHYLALGSKDGKVSLWDIY